MKKTRSAGGIVLNGKFVLIVNQHGNSWSLPKGHIEENENGVEAAKREIFEESGISDLHYVKELGVYERYRIGKGGKGEDKSELKIIHLYLFKTSQQELKPKDPDISEAKWINKYEVVNYLKHPKDKEFYLSVFKQF